MREVLPGSVSIDTLGVNLAEIRKKAGISKEKMAVLCGVSGLTYNRWETGVTRTAKQENFDRLRSVLEQYCGMKIDV